MSFRILSPAMQVAEHLKAGILRGRWRKEMPGVFHLALELGVNRTTIEAGLRLLETQGLLVSRGAGKRRNIVLPEAAAPPDIRVTILPYRPAGGADPLIMGLRHALEKAGFSSQLASRSLEEMGMRTSALAKLVEKTRSDAWIVVSGARQILEYFVEHSVPAFAMFGQRRGLKIAGCGPDKIPALQVATRRLLDFGHRKIALIVRRELREPRPAPFANTFLNELLTRGITINSAYNLPEWEESGDGLRRCLDTLFRITPPTALILDEPIFFHAAKEHLARKGILAPERVSLVCTDPDVSFAWAEPPVAHIHWEPQDVTRKAASWVNRVARGLLDQRQTLTKAVLVEGGTIGPVPSGILPK